MGTLPVTQFAEQTAADLDDHVIYKANGNLLYDEDGAGGKKAILFAKLSSAPGDVSNLDIVVLA